MYTSTKNSKSNNQPPELKQLTEEERSFHRKFSPSSKESSLFFMKEAQQKFSQLVEKLEKAEEYFIYETLMFGEVQNILEYLSKSIFVLKVENLQEKIVNILPRLWKKELNFPSQNMEFSELFALGAKIQQKNTDLEIQKLENVGKQAEKIKNFRTNFNKGMQTNTSEADQKISTLPPPPPFSSEYNSNQNKGIPLPPPLFQKGFNFQQEQMLRFNLIIEGCFDNPNRKRYPSIPNNPLFVFSEITKSALMSIPPTRQIQSFNDEQIYLYETGMIIPDQRHHFIDKLRRCSWYGPFKYQYSEYYYITTITDTGEHYGLYLGINSRSIGFCQTRDGWIPIGQSLKFSD